MIGNIEWAIAWPEYTQGVIKSFCNTVPTPLGGTHEIGLRNGLLKAIQNANLTNKNLNIIGEDISAGSVIILSIFISEPLFKVKLKKN